MVGGGVGGDQRASPPAETLETRASRCETPRGPPERKSEPPHRESGYIYLPPRAAAAPHTPQL
eukprot:scaffold324392_cov53-Tisochrysis_lutea.AAC.1